MPTCRPTYRAEEEKQVEDKLTFINKNVQVLKCIPKHSSANYCLSYFS